METWGCQSNVIESEYVLGALAKEKYLLTAVLEEADIALLNTCSIRSHAEDKVFSFLGRLAGWKRSRDGRMIVLLGCMATAWREKLLARAPYLDVVVGPDQYGKLAGVLKAKLSRVKDAPTVLTDFDPSFFPEADLTYSRHRHKAFVEIMKGCDKFCTFCVVPFTRGREISRPPEKILEEVRSLAAQGVKEVTLLGQNVNSYGLSLRSRGKTPTFAELLRATARVEGIERVRFTTSHPLDLSDDLIAVMAQEKNVCEHFHLPVQCGSDRILKRMNRKYTRAHYLERVRRLRETVADIAITTDLIVGFPGETEEDFKQTLDLLEEVRFDSVFSFKYSPRPGTPAARMLDAVPREVQDERLARLNALAWKHAAERHAERVGRVEEVLVDEANEKTAGTYAGKTRQNKTILFCAEGRTLFPGDRVMVKVEGHKIAQLHGTVVDVSCTVSS